MKMRILGALALAGAFLLLGQAARAQTQTNVTATIVDPLGIPYANGTYSIQLIPTGTNPSVNGQSIGGAFNGSLSATGSFNIALWPNASIVPAATTWQFTICTNPGGVAPPLGTGNQCTPPTVVTIAGATQSLSATLSAVAPQLTTIALGGGVTSLTATSPVVATPSPITGVGVLSCPACVTASGGGSISLLANQVAFGGGANAIVGNAGFTFITPVLSIPLTGSLAAGGTTILKDDQTLNNLSVGSGSLVAITTGVNNVGVGPSTLTLTTTGIDNTAVGEAALFQAAATAQKNTAVGNAALENVTSSANTAVGQAALESLTSGALNVALGSGAGQNVTTGSNNTFIGTLAGGGASTATANNIVIGAGNTSAISTGSNNIVIGTSVASGPGTNSNQLDIGDVILGTAINTPSSSVISFPGETCWNGSTSGSACTQAAAVAGTPTVVNPPTVDPTIFHSLLVSNVTGGANVTSWAVPGVTVNAQTGASYTVAASSSSTLGDRGSLITTSNGGAIAVTLPQAGTAGYANNYNFGLCNIGAGTATITPTTSTINGAASIALVTNRCAYVYSDGANYFTTVDYYGLPPAGSTAFSAITSATNTTAAMVCGTGCSIATSGSGTNQATTVVAAGTLQLIAGAGNVIQFRDSGGTETSMTTGLFTVYNALNVVGNGVASVQAAPAVITLDSGTSIGSTSLCASAVCPAGDYEVTAYIDITTACTTTGTYVVNLIYTDDQGSKTVPIDIQGTGATPATGVLTLASTANFGQASQIIRLTSGNLNYSTTATACGTGGPAVGNIYLDVTRRR